jgi:hypothetical protein
VRVKRDFPLGMPPGEHQNVLGPILPGSNQIILCEGIDLDVLQWLVSITEPGLGHFTGARPDRDHFPIVTIGDGRDGSLIERDRIEIGKIVVTPG